MTTTALRPAPARTHRRVPPPWAVLALLATTQFVLILDAAIVAIAMPSLATDLGFSQAELSWVPNAYGLLFGGFLLLGGRLADLLGRRRLFVVGLTVFTFASLAAAFAPSPLWLIAGRGAQGLAAAFVSPVALSLLLTTFPDGPARGRALSVWGAMAASGASAGVLLGGVLTEAFGWTSVFLVNVPIGLAAVAVALTLLDPTPGSGARGGFDLAGAVTVTGGLALLVYALVDANEAGWASAQTIGLGALSVALLTAFVVIESRVKDPLVPLGVFRNPTLRAANIISVATMAPAFAMFFFLVLYLQQVLGQSPLRAGVSQLPLTGVILASALVAPRVIGRFGARRTLFASLLLMAAGLAWLSRLSATGTYLSDVLGPTLVFAVGGGLSFVALIGAATTGVPAKESGLASGLINTTQQVGGALGLAVLAAVASAGTGDALAADPTATAAALTAGFSDALLVGAGVALLGAALVSLLPTAAEPAQAAAQADAEPVADAVAEPVAVPAG
jgi:EmrB/QacA subfamily drug resistance transporter